MKYPPRIGCIVNDLMSGAWIKAVTQNSKLDSQAPEEVRMLHQSKHCKYNNQDRNANPDSKLCNNNNKTI